jgi:hypothetical protein
MQIKKTILLISVIAVSAIVLLALTIPNLQVYVLRVYYRLDATVSFYRGRILYAKRVGSDPLTNLWLNLTYCKMSGSNTYNLTTYNMNASFVGLANYTTTTPSASSTTIQGEWYRGNSGNCLIHAQVYNGYNVTGTLTGFSGTNSTNCMFLAYSSSFNDPTVVGYVTYSLVTGIDNTFTVVCELQLQGTLS